MKEIERERERERVRMMWRIEKEDGKIEAECFFTGMLWGGAVAGVACKRIKARAFLGKRGNDEK